MRRPHDAQASTHTSSGKTAGTLFIVDWDDGAAEELQERLRSLGEAVPRPHASPALQPVSWEVMNCATTRQVGDRTTTLARGPLALRYLATAVIAAWRSRRYAQVVVWQQAIGYLMCMLPRWPRVLCAEEAAGSGRRRPRLIITTVLLSPSSTAPRFWGRMLLRLALRRADALVYFSREMALDTQRHCRGQAHKVFWTPLPHFDESAPQTAPSLQQDPLDAGQSETTTPAATPLRVFAGGSSDRDFDVVVRAFQGSDIPVTIVCRAEQAFQPPGPVGSNFTVHREVSHGAFESLTLAADIAVVTLSSAASGCGQLLFTFCMRHGIPVIATDCFGTRDYVTPGQTGLLVPAGDATALREAYEVLAGDAPLRRRIVAQAKARSAHHGLAGFVRAIEAVREQLSPTPEAVHRTRQH